MGIPLQPATDESPRRGDGRDWLFSRTGGAPSLAVAMQIFAGWLGGVAVVAVWYDFAITFEALFILSTLDAGTRVAHFMLQDLLGNLWKPRGSGGAHPNIIINSALIAAAWGYFLYFGTVDPLGGINSLWPLFGIANQMLATIALRVATSAMIRQRKARFGWVTLTPLSWLLAVTTAGFEKIMSRAANVGFLAHAAQLEAELSGPAVSSAWTVQIGRLVWNDRIDEVMTAVFMLVVWIIVADSIRAWWRLLSGVQTRPEREDEAAA
jgi:carbon starvation protein